MEEPERLEAEWVQEGFMQPSMKRIRFRCSQCDHQWTRTFKAEPARDPDCPNKYCADRRMVRDLAKQVANLTAMLESGQAPAQIGNNAKVMAIDTTAKIVMSDHKLTDLKDSVRPGEAMVPKLPIPMQKAADSFFSGGAQALGTKETMAQRRMKAIGARAIAGSFRDGAVAPNQVLPRTKWASVRQSNAGFDSSRATAEGNGRR